MQADGTIGLRLGGATQIYGVFPGLKAPQKLLPLDVGYTPRWIIPLNDWLYLKISNSVRPMRLLGRLKSRTLDKRLIQVIDLTQDQAVKRFAEGSRLKPIYLALAKPTVDDVAREFQSNAKKTLILLCHCTKDGRFYVTDSSGRQTFLDISGKELNALAKKSDCDLIALGCSSAKGDVPAGALDAFNPLSAIQRVEKAVDAPDQLGFLEDIASDKLDMVVDNKVFSNADEAIQFDLYVKTEAKTPDVNPTNKVGTISVVPGMDKTELATNVMRTHTSTPASVSGRRWRDASVLSD